MVSGNTRDDLLSKHESMLQQVGAQSSSVFTTPENISPTTNRASCAKQLKKLRLVGLDDLILGQVNAGAYILCRTVSAPLTMVSTISICTCHDGGYIRVAIYDFVGSQAEANKKFPKGTIFAIKAPYYKIALDGDLCVRVDNPANIVILNSLDLNVQKRAPHWASSAPKEDAKQPGPKVASPQVISPEQVADVPKKVKVAPKAPPASVPKTSPRVPASKVIVSGDVEPAKSAPLKTAAAPVKAAAAVTTAAVVKAVAPVVPKVVPVKLAPAKKTSDPVKSAPAVVNKAADPSEPTSQNVTTPNTSTSDKITSDEYRVDGNEKLKRGEFDEALKSYRKAADLNPNDIAALSNQAEVWLRLGAWTTAVRYANLAIAKDKSHAKSLFRRARGLMGRESYKAALEQLRDPLLVGCGEVDELEKQCYKLMRQHEFGDYDWLTMAENLDGHPETRFTQVADFKGPIKPKKGGGVMAVSNLKKGQLICVSKSIVSVLSSELSGGLIKEGDLREKDSPVTKALSSRLMQKLPRERALALDLAAASPQRSEEEIVHQLVASSAIGFIPVLQGGMTHEFEIEDGHAGAGVWLLPSKFSSSCTPNCSFRVFGDLMVIVTNTAVAKADSLTVSYNKHKGEECKCERCMYLASPGPEWRDTHLDSYSGTPGFVQELVYRIHHDLKTLPAFAGVDAVKLLHYLGHMLLDDDQREQALRCFTTVYELASTSQYLRDVCPEICATAARHCSEATDWAEEKQEWIDVATKDIHMYGPVISIALADMDALGIRGYFSSKCECFQRG